MGDFIDQVAESLIDIVPQATEAGVEVVEIATEVAQTADYTAYLEALLVNSNYVVGFMLFGVVAALCYFGYKFFRIFF